MPQSTPTAERRRRLAIYAAPRGTSPEGERAARWLGRHIDPLPAPAAASTERIGPDELADVTTEPRLYGFHATLKPPFHLADGADPDELDEAVAALAARLAPVTTPPLQVDLLDRFVALLPDGATDAVDELAAACVVELDPFRRPADELDLARRRRADLTRRQDELLLAWGYPYVLDQFRLHLTLTRRLAPAEVDPVLDAAREWFAPLDGEPLLIDELCVVEQAGPGEPFVVVARHPLGSPVGK